MNLPRPLSHALFRLRTEAPPETRIFLLKDLEVLIEDPDAPAEEVGAFHIRLVAAVHA